MRRRMLNPDFFTDPDIVANLDAYGRLLYQGMWCVADDSGCLELNPLLLKMKVLPGDETVSIDDIRDYFDKLIELNKIITYKVDGKEYGWLKNFHKHQSLNKPNAPSVPLPKWITWHGESEKRHERYYEVEYEEYKNNLEGQGTDNGKTEERQQKDVSCPEEKRSKEKLKEENICSSSIGEIFEKVFCRSISPYQNEVLDTFVDDGMNQEVIKYAIKYCGDQGARSFKYLKKVLNSWASDGVTTVDDAKKAVERFESQKEASKNGSSQQSDQDAREKDYTEGAPEGFFKD